MARPRNYKAAIENPVTDVINDMLEKRDDMSIAEISVKMGFNRNSNFLYQVKSGLTNFPIARLRDFCSALDMNPQPLFDAIMKEHYQGIIDATKYVEQYKARP